jgi:hypothetical protein
MKSVLKLICLLGIVVLVMITALAFSALFQLPLTAELPPILSVGILPVVGCAVWGICTAVFTKRHTTATGFG